MPLQVPVFLLCHRIQISSQLGWTDEFVFSLAIRERQELFNWGDVPLVSFDVISVDAGIDEMM